MKYYSEILKQFYDTEDELIAEESAHKQKEEEKEARIAEHKKIYEEYLDAMEKYLKSKQRFCKDYGDYSYVRIFYF